MHMSNLCCSEWDLPSRNEFQVKYVATNISTALSENYDDAEKIFPHSTFCRANMSPLEYALPTQITNCGDTMYGKVVVSRMSMGFLAAHSVSTRLLSGSAVRGQHCVTTHAVQMASVSDCASLSEHESLV